MNKQELIKQIKKLFVFGVKDYIERDEVLVLVEQLDEPEKGHADEAPRYVKNILARLRELPLHDREVWLKAIMGEFEKDFSHAKWREGYEQGKFEGEWVGNQLKDADKIRQELNKLVIPQFVADWYEDVADEFYIVLERLVLNYRNNTNMPICKWFLETEDALKILINMHQFGYTIKKEKRYLVKVKGVCGNHETLNCEKHSKKWLFSDWEENSLYKTKHTRKELEEAGFSEVFNSPLFEVEEVE
jgi:hypothetical protein